MSQLATTEALSILAPPRPGWAYFGRALFHPLGLAALSVGVAIGVCLGSLIGTLAVLAAHTAVLGATARTHTFRRCVDEHCALEERQKRARQREDRMLHAAAEHRDQYTELSARVDEVERVDGGRLSGRLELQDLLDYYTDLSVAHRRCIEGLALADRGQLAAQLDEYSRRGELNNRRRQRAEIIARRIRHWDECKARAEDLAETLAVVAELIRLVGQRAACPSVDNELEREIESRLLDLDEQETALRELTEAAAA
ncbi:MAG TPA: hypothetical protein VL172_21625 [Kofleriaceae bacterium]|nr:hypothetical protein [Kofleriaceae bacterium]